MNDSISKTIREIRVSRGLPQERMAADLNVSVNYISLLENGRKKPGMRFLKKFSKKYNIPLLLLAGDSIVPKAKTPKERELRDKVVNLINDLEKTFLKV